LLSLWLVSGEIRGEDGQWPTGVTAALTLCEGAGAPSSPDSDIAALPPEIAASVSDASLQLGFDGYVPLFHFPLFDFSGMKNGHVVVSVEGATGAIECLEPEWLYQRLKSHQKDAVWFAQLQLLLGTMEKRFATFYLGPYNRSDAVAWVAAGIPLPIASDLVMRRQLDQAQMGFDPTSIQYVCSAPGLCYVLSAHGDGERHAFDSRTRRFVPADRLRFSGRAYVKPPPPTLGKEGKRGGEWYPDVPDLQQSSFGCLPITGCDPENVDCAPVAAANVLRFYANEGVGYECIGNTGNNSLVDHLRYYMDWDGTDDWLFDLLGTSMYKIDNGIVDTCEFYSQQLDFEADPANNIFTTYGTFKSHIANVGPLMILADGDICLLEQEDDWNEQCWSDVKHAMTVIGYHEEDTEWLVLRDLTGLTSATVYYDYEEYGGWDGSVRIWPGGSCPAVVSLSEIDVATSPNSVELRWTTNWEVGNAGWTVCRSLAEGDAQCDLINSDVISPYQFLYEFVDSQVHQGWKYYYSVDAIQLDGSIERFGPVWAIPNDIDLDNSQRIDGLDLLIASKAGAGTILTGEGQGDCGQQGVTTDMAGPTQWPVLFGCRTSSNRLIVSNARHENNAGNMHGTVGESAK